MKKTLLLTMFFWALSIGASNAQEDQGQAAGGMMMPAYPYQMMSPYQQQMPPWTMRGPGMGGYGFQGYGGSPMSGMGYGPGMMNQPGMTGSNPYTTGPGVMMGQGMMQYGMGPGMIRGLGAMGYISSEKFQKFFDETKDLRKKMNSLMFDYAELLRKPDHNPTERVELENQIQKLRQQVYEKAPRYQWPF